MRRKTLNNNLKDVLDVGTIDEVYKRLSLDKNVRAQELSLDDYIKMYKVIYER